MKTNKLNTFIAVILSFFIFSSCDKVEEITQKDVVITPDYVEFTIPQVTNTEEGSFGEPFEVKLNLDSLIKSKASAFGVSNIKSINITSLRIALQEQREDSNFKVLEKISVEISSAGQTSKVLATANNSDHTTNKYELVLPVTGGNIELKDYLKASSFSYAVTGKAKNPTEQPVRARLYATYTFKLGL